MKNEVDETRLRSTDRADVWAEEFAKVHPEIDQGLMIGWFANCAENAKDRLRAQRRTQLAGQISAVFEFNDAKNFVHADGPSVPDDKTGEFIMKSLGEELTEIETGLIEGDVVKIVDGIIDLTYFAYGHLRRMGLTLEQAEACFDAVHEANLTKTKGVTENRGGFENDATKPANFVPPDEQIRNVLFDRDYSSAGSEQGCDG